MNMIPIDDEAVTAAAQASTRKACGGVKHWEVEPVAHQPNNMTTAALDIVRATLADGTGFSSFREDAATCVRISDVAVDPHRGATGRPR